MKLLDKLIQNRAQKVQAQQSSVRSRYRRLILSLARDQQPDGDPEAAAALLDEMGKDDAQLRLDVKRAESCIARQSAEHSLPELTKRLAESDQSLAKIQSELESVISSFHGKMNPLRASRGAIESEIRTARDRCRQVEHEDFPDWIGEIQIKIMRLRQSSSQPSLRVSKIVSSLTFDLAEAKRSKDSENVSKIEPQLNFATAAAESIKSKLQAAKEIEATINSLICAESGLVMLTAESTPESIVGDADLSPIVLPPELS